jgi:hypothetical protein
LHHLRGGVIAPCTIDLVAKSFLLRVLIELVVEVIEKSFCSHVVKVEVVEEGLYG